MWYDVVVEGGGMAATPLFEAQAKKILSGDLSFVAFLRYRYYYLCFCCKSHVHSFCSMFSVQISECLCINH